MIREFNVAECVPQITDLLAENWRESGMDFPLEPDLDLYRELQENGQLIALGAFDDGRMFGYSTAILTPHLFNPGILVCQNDATFVTVSHRGGALPGRLILMTESLAKERGATLMMWSVPPYSALHNALAKRGYELDEVSLSRRLA